MNKVIKLLQPTDFRNFKGWVSQGNINPVFVASMRVPQGDSYALQDVYCKIYPFTDTDRSVFNEIVGYLFAHALQIPQPSHAYIALVDTVTIIANSHGHITDELLAMLQGKSYYPIFCTTKIDKSKTAFDFHAPFGGNNIPPTLLNEIGKWKYLPDTLAMDNTIAHTDRHLNNILRTGKQSYHVIDNGILASDDGTPWQVADLDSHKNYKNKLWQFTQEYIPQSWKTISNNVMRTCALHPKAVASCLDELNYWVKALYDKQQIDYNAFIDFLTKRANESEYYHAQRLNRLI